MRVRYGKPIKVKSLLGTFNLTGQGTTTVGFMVSSNEGHFKYQASVTNLRKFGIFNGHKYFLCAKSEFALDSFVFMSSSSWYQELYKSTTPTYANNYSYVNIENVSADNSNIAVLIWCKNHVSWEVYDGIVIDLTETFGSGKEPTAQQFYNKYNKYFSLIASGEEITIDDKSGQVSYDKPILLKSLWGDQSSLTAVQPSVSGNYIYLGKDGYSIQSSYGTNTNLEDFNTPIISGHKYILVIYQNGAQTFHMFSQSGEDKWRWTTAGIYKVGQLTYCYYTSDANIVLKNFYQGYSEGGGIPTLTKDFFIDLTDTFGAGNEPTATEFYNKYKGYFLDLCAGKQIVVGKGKIAGGSSDIYYGYNQKMSLSAGGANECSHTYDETTYEHTLTANSSTTRTYFGMSCGDLSSLKGHKVLFIANITEISISSFSNFNGEWAFSRSTITDRQRATTVGLTYCIGTWRETASTNYFNASRSSGTFTQGDYFKTNYVQFIDLTEWFGAGKEPSTLAEFKEKFSKDYYGFCPTPIKLTQYQIEVVPTYGYNQLGPLWTTNTYNGVTATIKNDGKDIELSGTATGWYTKDKNLGQIIPSGHKVLIMSEMINPTGANFGYRLRYNSDEPVYANNEFNKIHTLTGNINKFQLYADLGDNCTGIKLNNLVIIDLTDWYGAGNEPTTISEFKATFPNLYYPYSKKRLLNKYMINKLTK